MWGDGGAGRLVPGEKGDMIMIGEGVHDSSESTGIVTVEGKGGGEGKATMRE